MDNRHLQKQIENNQVNADQKRKQAQQLRINASTLYDSGDESSHDSTRAQYLEIEAKKQEDEADGLEAEVTKLQQQLEQNNAKIQKLQSDRIAKITSHDQEIARIDQELKNLQGEAYM